MLQGRYGGNMDCREIRAGATLVLPVAHDGGGLYFGDCKALMGDGEIVGPPEVGALVTATAEPRARPASMTWPRIETADSMTTLVSGKPLEWSARQAYRELLEWVVEDYEIARPQAALLLAMVAHAGICQISNTDYTAYCVAPRDVLEPYRALTPLAHEAARGDDDHVVDDAVAHGQQAVVQVDAAARVVRDDLQAIADRGPLVERGRRRRSRAPR